MVKDLTPKKSQKELIVAAIELLKAKGFDINPFTVADEAGIPRSVLYRNTEFMELVKLAKSDGAEPADQPTDGVTERVAELEDRCKILEEQLWNLEAQNETLAKEKQDAWNSGFQAGLEEATKRQAAEAQAQADFAPTPQPVAQQPAPAPAEVAAPKPAPPPQPTAPPPPPPAPELKPQPATPEPVTAVAQAAAVVEQPAPAQQSNGQDPKSPVQLGNRSDTLDIRKPETKQLNLNATGPQQDFAAPPAPAADNHAQSPGIFPDEIKDGVFNAARSGPYTGANFNPLVELSWRDVETVYNFAAAGLKDLAKQVPDSTQPDKPATPEELAGVAWEDPASASSFAAIPPAPAAPDLETSKEAMDTYRQYAYNTNYSLAENVEGVFDQSTPASESLSESGSLFPSEDVLTRFEPQPEASLQESAPAKPHHNTTVPPQPFATPSKAYSDPQQQFSDAHYTEVSAYQKQKPAPPSYMNDGFFDPLPSEEGYVQYDDGQTAQEPATDEHSFNPEEARARATRTGDRLQAIADPRDFTTSEAVVDLDTLDIFDDLDDYVDINKIEIIDDVKTESTQEEEDLKTAGDELRELIKGRIKQADTTPPDPASRSMGGTAQAAAAEKGGGARNKFVGGKSQAGTQEATSGAVPVSGPPGGAFLPKLTPEIRRHCMILGVSQEPAELTKEKVMLAWKNQIASPGVHPDHGGDTETAVALNTAKDALIRWLDTNAPKLGKKFGSGGPKPGPGPGPQPGAQ